MTLSCALSYFFRFSNPRRVLLYFFEAPEVASREFLPPFAARVLT